MRVALFIASVLLSFAGAIPQSEACSGCGCRGGPGYRAPDGRCVGWADIGRKCGSPPETRCTPEGPNAGAAEAAKFGVKAIESKQPKDVAPK
jgi:hypothetical protein